MAEDGTGNLLAGGGQGGDFSPAKGCKLQTAGDLGGNPLSLASLPGFGFTRLQRILSNHPDIHMQADPWFMLHPLYALNRGELNAEFDAGKARQTPDSSYPVPVSGKNNLDDDQYAPMPVVSIIMPTKNRLDLIGRALDSITAQTYRNWELIVVNDGGDDISTVVDSRASRRPIRSIRLDKSVGQAAARNIAMHEARGQIICYLDDDDIYLPHHLETVVTALSRKGRSVVYTDAVLVPEWYNNSAPREAGERTNPYEHGEFSRDRLLVNNYIPINTWAHWKTCIDKIGVFDESLNCYEDWEFLLRLSGHYEFTHIRQTTVEVMFRLDREDNVTRQRPSDTTDTYRSIYQRHSENLPEKLVRERDMKLQSLEIFMDNRQQAGQLLSDTAFVDVDENYGMRDSSELVSERRQLQYLQEQFHSRMEELGYVLPSIHLVMVADENDAVKIADTIDSLAQQIYTGWGLSVISTVSPPHQNFETLPMLEWIQSEDVQQSLVDTMRQSACDWVAPVTPGDKFEPESLSILVDYINQNPGWKFISSDEDCVDALGTQVEHKFRPAINSDYLQSCPYIGNVSLLHKDMLNLISTDISITAAFFYDLGLKVFDKHGAFAIGHIPTLL